MTVFQRDARKNDVHVVTRSVTDSRFPLFCFRGEMCKHILNAQVTIRAPCCKQWYDCAECHAEKQTHALAKTTEMTFMCKKCRKAFRKDMSTYEESDEYCPHCDNHYVIDAKTPQAVIGIEAEDTRIDSRIIKDDRTQQHAVQSIYDMDFSDKIG